MHKRLDLIECAGARIRIESVKKTQRFALRERKGLWLTLTSLVFISKRFKVCYNAPSVGKKGDENL